MITPGMHSDDPAASLPCVVEWPGDGESHYLGHDNSNSITLAIDTSPGQMLFRLRIGLEQRRPLGKTSLYLHIPPDRLRTAALCDSGESQPSVQPDKMVSVWLELNSPADLVAPNWPLAPKNKANSTTLESTKTLARQTVLSLHIPDRRRDGWLERLCQDLSGRALRSLPVDLHSMYKGEGGVLVSPEQLLPGALSQCPPTYDEVQSGPSGKTPTPPTTCEC